MSNTIDPNSAPAGPAGASASSPATNAGPVDQSVVNVLTLQLALLKKTPGVPPKVIARLEQELDALKAGNMTAEDAQKSFEEAKQEAIDKSIKQTSYTIINTMANELAKEINNPMLEELKKDGDEQGDN